MRYKSKVLARFPHAKPVVVRRWAGGDPHYVQIWADPNRKPTLALDPFTSDAELPHAHPQNYAQAWRSAYYWCMRNPAVRDHVDALLTDAPDARWVR